MNGDEWRGVLIFNFSCVNIQPLLLGDFMEKFWYKNYDKGVNPEINFLGAPDKPSGRGCGLLTQNRRQTIHEERYMAYEDKQDNKI